MKSLKHNILFSSGGNILLIAIQFAFTPLYVWLLGAEQFGIVAFGLTLLTTVIFLNQSTSPVLIRELGRLGWESETAGEAWELLRTIEVVAVGIGILVGGVIFAAAPFIAGHWLQTPHLTDRELLNSVRLIGIAVACQWPTFLYRSAFIGLGRQDIFVLISVPFALIHAAGAVILLWLVSPNVILFFIWQSATYSLHCMFLRFFLLRAMPSPPATVAISVARIQALWRFAAGTLAIGAITSLLTQSDKLIVSKFASLERFSAYSLASMFAIQFVTAVVSPVSVSLLPHFSRLLASADQTALAHEYHKWTQVMTAVVLPVVGVMLFFGKPLLEVWLGPSSPLIPPMLEVLPWFSVGTIFNIMMITPYILQMAAGTTMLIATFNAMAFVLMMPLLIFGVSSFGMVAGAIAWLTLNISYVVVMVPLMHRNLLPAEKWQWWIGDTMAPTALALLVFACSRALAPPDQGMLAGVAHAAATLIVVVGLLAVILPRVRAEVRKLWNSPH